jgi:hypothetical protein
MMRWYHRNRDPLGHRCVALPRIASRRHDDFRQRRFLDPDPLSKDGEVGEGDHLSRTPFHDSRIQGEEASNGGSRKGNDATVAVPPLIRRINTMIMEKR